LHAAGRRFDSCRLHMEIYKLDLHRMRHKDARREVIRFVESHWTGPAELEIITGNSSKMKGLVMNVLDEYNLTYQISRMFDLNNQGYIVTWTE
jgi:DNA-nicking Smr family endonuclease